MTSFSADIGPNALAYARLISSAAFAGIAAPLRQAIVDHAPSAGSPVVHFVALAELIYAQRDRLPAEVLSFGAACAYLCRVHNWHGLGEGRGWAMQQTLQRAAGDPPPAGAPWPAPDQDPEPSRDAINAAAAA